MNKQGTSSVFTISEKEIKYLTPGSNIPHYKISLFISLAQKLEEHQKA